MFFCEFCKIFKNIFWQNTSGWLLLKFICEFWEVFQNSSFTEHLFFRNCSLHVQVAEFQPADTVKNYFTGAFQAIYTRTRSSHSKAFIYLKSLEIISEEVNLQWSCEMPTWKFTKKTLPHILLHAFCLYFLRTHHDSSEQALKVCKQNFFQET